VQLRGASTHPEVKRMGHIFSVEIKSKSHVKNITISDEAHDRVLFEGDLGDLEEVAFIGGSMLEVRGTNGVLRIELGEEETRKLMSQMSATRA
jgi:hypothetical protein